MAVELSSNWKKLQAQIKSEPSSKPLAKKPAAPSAANPPKKPLRATAVTGKRPRETAQTSDRKNHPPSKRPRSRPPPPSSTSGRAAMGVTQSSQPTQNKAVTPSLALWAEENDISPESLAQAYGLGNVRGRGSRAGAVDAETSRAALAAAAKDDRENGGLTDGLDVGRYVALDCEMVGVGEGGHDDALARVSLVDFFGRQVYDSYVQMQPGQRVVDWRTSVSGITARHLRQARPFEEVRGTVAALLRGDPPPSAGPAAAVVTPAARKIQQAGGRILVGHDVRHDLQVLELTHPPRLIRDTAKFSGFKQYGHGPKPALRVLAQTQLGVSIQQGAHSSVVDARVTMQLFRLHKPAFDVECATRFGDDGDDAHAKSVGSGPSSKRRPKKGKRRH